MLHKHYGPRGAEEELEEFWDSIPEGADMLPGPVVDNPADALSTLNVLGGPARLNAAEPYSPGFLTETPVIHDRPGPDGDVSERIDNLYGVLGPAEDDPLGSWTGVPADREDASPTQDADDL